jgi:2-amino-4-hydroxy-6-hydroxymethyldihydropteridine diphosphokinase
MRAPGVVVYLGLGANLEDRAGQLQRGVEQLQEGGVAVRRASHLYAGAYVGPGTPQPEYWNAVVEAETALAPLMLLDFVQRLEAAAGRRAGTHGLPRPLDVDVLFYGGWSIWHPRLVVPHPRLAARRFVLEPLAELGVLELLPLPELPACLAAARQSQPLEVLPHRLLPGAARAALPA